MKTKEAPVPATPTLVGTVVLKFINGKVETRSNVSVDLVGEWMILTEADGKVTGVRFIDHWTWEAAAR